MSNINKQGILTGEMFVAVRLSDLSMYKGHIVADDRYCIVLVQNHWNGSCDYGLSNLSTMIKTKYSYRFHWTIHWAIVSDITESSFHEFSPLGAHMDADLIVIGKELLVSTWSEITIEQAEKIAKALKSSPSGKLSLFHFL